MNRHLLLSVFWIAAISSVAQASPAKSAPEIYTCPTLQQGQTYKYGVNIEGWFLWAQADRFTIRQDFVWAVPDIKKDPFIDEVRISCTSKRMNGILVAAIRNVKGVSDCTGNVTATGSFQFNCQ